MVPCAMSCVSQAQGIHCVSAVLDCCAPLSWCLLLCLSGALFLQCYFRPLEVIMHLPYNETSQQHVFLGRTQECFEVTLTRRPDATNLGLDFSKSEDCVSRQRMCYV